jgi:hypothetical protein
VTKTILYAPTHIIGGKPALGNVSNNPDAAPSLCWGGDGLLDPRYALSTGNRPDALAAGLSAILAPNLLGFIGSGAIQTVSAVPSTIAVANIAAAANAVQNAPMVLRAATGAGISVLTAAQLLLPSLVTVPIGTLALDGPVGYKQFGAGFQSWYYDPATMLARTLSITGSTSATGGAFLASGYDLYGYPQTDLITVGAGAVTGNGHKPFKYVTSVVPQFADAHNYSAGTSDIYDLGLAADFFSDADVYWNNVVQLVAQFTAAVTTSPATNVTGGPRGTFTAGSASDGTKRLQIFVDPSAARLAQAGASGVVGSAMSVGLFGVTPA